MTFNTPLIQAKFIKRYKRFFVDAALPDGQMITAHCPNTGSMRGLLHENAPCWLSLADNPNRKLRYTLEAIEADGTLVGVNTSRPNYLVKTAIENGIITELQGYEQLRMEVKYGVNSRIDLHLASPHLPDCYVEVKNVTLCEDNILKFPDAVTTRGLKHLAELASVAAQGQRAVMLFLAQRADGTHFAPAADIDPAYAAALRDVNQQGVELLCYRCSLTPQAIHVYNKVDIYL